MHVLFACLADHASADAQGGKLNVMGIFDNIGGHGFPVTHASMALAIRVQTEHEDNGKKRKLTIRMRDADHKELAKIDAEIQCGAVPPGEFGTANLIVQMQNVVFVKPGRYHMAVSADAGKEVRIPLSVRLA